MVRTGLIRAGGTILAAVMVGGCAAPPAEQRTTVDAGTEAARMAAAAHADDRAAAGAPPAAPEAAPAPAPSAPSNAPAAAAPPAAPAAERVSVPLAGESFRPEWWIDEPVKQNGTYTVAASADAATVRDSRRGAVVTGESFALGDGGSIRIEPEVHAVRTVRLPSGYYRTFVLMSWPLPEPKR